MPFCDIEEPTWLEIVGNHFAPGSQIGEPANDTMGGIDDIKFASRIQDVGQMIKIATEKSCIQMKLLAQ